MRKKKAANPIFLTKKNNRIIEEDHKEKEFALKGIPNIPNCTNNRVLNTHVKKKNLKNKYPNKKKSNRKKSEREKSP